VARRAEVGVGTLVLDSEGVVKAARGDPVVRRHLEQARNRGMRVVVSAITLTEILRGRPEDAVLHRVLAKITQIPVTSERASRAGVLLGETGLDRHVHAIDAVVAAAALEQERPVVLLTSDLDDLSRLTEEPGRDNSWVPRRTRSRGSRRRGWRCSAGPP
jgi:predicted nucleic acid-binding protein